MLTQIITNGNTSLPKLICNFLSDELREFFSIRSLKQTLEGKRILVEYSLNGIYRPKYEDCSFPYWRLELPFEEALDRVLFTDHFSEKYYLSSLSLGAKVRGVTELVMVSKQIRNSDPEGVSLFIGSEGTGTHTHKDPTDSLIVVMSGSKKVHLFSPNINDKLFPLSLPDCQSKFSGLSDNDIKTFFNSLNKNEERYSIKLNKGSALFIPSGWWHRIENIGPTVSISIFWRT